MHNYHERDSNLSMHNINYNRFRITCFSQHEVSKSQRGNCIPIKCDTGIKQNIFVANNNQLERY